MREPQNYQNTSEFIEEEKAQNESPIMVLTPVIPVVIYHGKAPWNGDNSMNRMFEFFEGIEQLIPQQRYIVFDLSIMPDEKIRGIAEVKTFIMALKYSRGRLLFEKLPQIIGVFKYASAVSQEYLEVIIYYQKYFMPVDKMAEFSTTNQHFDLYY